MIDNDPIALRKVYFDAWQKQINKQPMSAMEAIIVDIIKRHPEYHPIFADQNNFDSYSAEKFALDHNPFFHLALHVTIAEQVSTDRPKGIKALYLKILKKHKDRTMAEHKIMECLARVLVESFQKEGVNNEAIYLEAIKRLV